MNLRGFFSNFAIWTTPPLNKAQKSTRAFHKQHFYKQH